jgi:hypothetical protein
MAGPPAEIVAHLAASGAHELYIGRDHDSTVPARRAHSTPHHHSCARAHWRGNSSLRNATARHSAPSRSDAALSEWIGSERVRGCRVTMF